MRRVLLAAVLFQLAAVAEAKEYGHYDIKNLVAVSKSADGQYSATLNFSLLDQVLSDLSLHTNIYPPQFDSPQDRQRAINDVAAISGILDTLLSGHVTNPQLLLRAGKLNSAGHNLDIRGADKKAIAAFTALLSQTPDDPAANYLYGMFLAGTTKQAEAIPLLEKAKSLGVADADYTLGLVYSGIGNKDKALENLEHYAKRVPNDTNVPKLIDAIRNGRIERKQGLPPAN